LDWRPPLLLRVLTFAGAPAAIQLAYGVFDLPDENWAVTSVALVMQTQAGCPCK
jgi:hypothetical protein